ncbi:MAG: U32 family peptidase, partial [Bacteroidales bacterium]|nr:U32 family peptidase [Bacteroidales bacterium]
MKHHKTKTKILAPAGSYESLMAAINAGANAVYFGVGKLNMRSRSS